VSNFHTVLCSCSVLSYPRLSLFACGALLLEASLISAAALDNGQLVKDEHFTLFEAVGALEVSGFITALHINLSYVLSSS
jgi:hypothetical protein